LLAHGQWFSPGTPASFTTKTGRHEIAEILLKVVLNTKNQINLLLWIHHIATSGALMVGFTTTPRYEWDSNSQL
jgi:hypothetical protein